MTSARADGLLTPADVRRLAAELGLRPAKRFGQNFVIDQNTIRRIVRLADVCPGDAVLEVGPGLGSLTLGLLAAGASVTAIEVDRRMAARLPGTVAAFQPEGASRLRVITADAIRMDLPIPDAERFSAPPRALVANLPYNIAVPVLLRVLAQQPSVERGVVMVQAEVADRLAASPGQAAYGAPSAKLRWFGSARVLGSVPATVFWPVPRVGSALVGFERDEPPEAGACRADVFACIDAAFGKRRKTIRKALSGWGAGPTTTSAILARARVDPADRAEVLSVGDFARIAGARAALTQT